MNKIIPLENLVELGLLFEANRTIFNPLGFHLEPVMDGDKILTFSLSKTDDLVGVTMSPSVFEDGDSKFTAFMDGEGQDRLASRRGILRFDTQGSADQGTESLRPSKL